MMLKETARYVESIMKDDATGHDFFHVQRVVKITEIILKKEDADPYVALMAAYLHDLDDPKLNHTDTLLARNYLDRTDQTKDLKNKIIEITENLSFSSHKAGKSVSSIEGMIVQDADRLDALGAIGIARCFAYGGSEHRSIYKGKKDDDSSLAHFYQKLLKLESLMNTAYGKQIARKKTKYMRKYLDAFHEEWI